MGSFFQKKIIIVIHGLANKPSRKLLEKWCRLSVREGLKTIGENGTPFKLKLVYWADLMHEKPQTFKEKDKKSDAYLDDPYLPGNPEEYRDFKPSLIKQKILDKLEKKMDKVFFDESSFVNFEKFANILIRNLFKDLDCYYHRDCPVTVYRGIPAKDAIRGRLADMLRKYRKHDILLIAHSMGTIISYDVLTQVTPDVSVHTLITIGSPLALPVILKKILLEQGKEYHKETKPNTPDNINRAWYNFADLDDPIAVNYTLADDYLPNGRGIAPKDVVVYNNYKNEGKRSPHKLYGYLRAPEVARVIYDFCAEGRNKSLFALRKAIRSIFCR